MRGKRAQPAAATPPKIGRWTIRLSTAAFAIAVVLVTAVTQNGGVDGVVDRANDQITKVVDEAGRRETSTQGTGSMLCDAQLTKALAAARRASPAGATVESLRITPEQVDAFVAGRDGARRAISVDRDFDVRTSDAGSGEQRGIPWSRVPTDVPARLIRTIEGKLGLRPADLDYLLLITSKSSFDGRRNDSWGAYYSEPPLKNDATAALDGTDVRLLGTPDAKTRATMRASSRRTLASLAQAERQIKASSLPQATRRQALENIRRTRALAKKNLKAAGG